MCKVCHGICVFQKLCKVTNLFSYMQIKNEKCNHFVALFTISVNFSTLRIFRSSLKPQSVCGYLSDVRTITF